MYILNAEISKKETYPSKKKHLINIIAFGGTQA